MYALGLHADGHLLKAALLRREKGQVLVELVRTFDLQETEDALGLLAPILENKKALLVTGLDAWDVIVREIELKLKRKREILSVLPFQSESLIPYPLDEAILVPFARAQGKDQSEVTLLATKKEHLDAHLEKMAGYKIDPDWVSASPTALWRYASSYLAEESSSIFHLGMEKSCCLCFNKDKLLFSQTVNFGLKQLIDSLEHDSPGKSFEDLDFFAIDPEDFPKLSETFDRFKKEWERQMAFLEKKGLPQAFSFLGDIPLSFRLFLEREHRGEKGDHPSYAIPIGLALDAIKQDENSVQLRQNVYASPKLFKKRMQNLGLCLFSIAALTFATWGSTHLFLSKKESVLIEKVETYRGEPIENDGLLSTVKNWSKTLGGRKVPFPYQLTAPPVSDLLAWISSHPQLKVEGIEMKRIQYVLVKYPMVGKSNAPYQAKVELDFSTTSPTLAREFHDALLKGDEMVNTKHDIGWHVHENSYHTSFILRDRSL